MYPVPEPEPFEEDPPADQTVAWRIFALKQMGFDLGTSIVLAANKQVELRAIESALENGCSLELAVDIFS